MKDKENMEMKAERKFDGKRILKDYGIITAGCLLYAVAFNWLFVPNHIVMGGFTGLAQTVNRLIPFLPVGVTVAVLNIPLFVLGIRLQGMHLCFSSLFAMLTSSLFIDLTAGLWAFPPMEDALVACVFGGALIGVSMGMLLWVGATTGGSDMAARLLKFKFTHISVGKLCLAIDVFVILFYTVAFKRMNDAFYGIIAMYICSISMDSLIYGRKNAKVACVICDKGKEMNEQLTALNLGITKIQAKGGFSDNEKTILICAFKPSKISAIKSVVLAVDPAAFVIICDAQDVFGEGFAECMLDSL